MATYEDAVVSKEIYEYLTKDINWELPDIDFNDSKYNLPASVLSALQSAPDKLDNSALTNAVFDNKVKEYGKVAGTGTFDAVMESIKAHLWVEYNKGRITGAEYSGAFVQLTSVALQSSVQFLVSRDKAYWDALTAQIQSIISSIQLQTEKMKYLVARVQCYLTSAQFASENMKLGTMNQQIASMRLKDNRDERTTAAQVSLMNQQVDSFKRKDERETVKLQTDAWVAQKGVDDGTLVPSTLANTSIDTAMSKTLANIGLR